MMGTPRENQRVEDEAIVKGIHYKEVLVLIAGLDPDSIGGRLAKSALTGKVVDAKS